MSSHLTPELSTWLNAQRQAGQTDDAIAAAMVKSGWTQAQALAALRQPPVPSQEPEHTPVSFTPGIPEPAIKEGMHQLWAGDRNVDVLISMQLPRVVVFGGLLSDEECAQLRSLAQTRLARSQTVRTDTGLSEVNDARTSNGMFFTRGENELIQRIETRIAHLLQWPIENGEGLQVLHYSPGAEYKPHFDYFDPAHPGTASILRRGGQRLASLVMYLNTPASGGATIFPDVELDVRPIQGNAVFFSYDRADPATRTLHGGAPVLEGEKWVATKWLRQGHFR